MPIPRHKTVSRVAVLCNCLHHDENVLTAITHACILVCSLVRAFCRIFNLHHSGLELRVENAEITTEEDLATNTFYVTDYYGRKVARASGCVTIHVVEPAFATVSFCLPLAVLLIA